MKTKSSLAIFLLSAGQLFSALTSQDLKNLPATAVTEVIVRFPSMPTSAQLAAITGKGGSLKKTLKRMPIAIYSLPTASVNALTDPDSLALLVLLQFRPVPAATGCLLSKDALAPSRLQRRHLRGGFLIVG